MFPWILCAAAVSVTVNIVLVVKLMAMHKGMKEIGTLFGEHLSGDTNTLITVSSGDRYVRRLAARINTELKTLRRQRRRYLNGDFELKEAVTNISHDLRTPLTAISGYLELLEREDKSEAVERYLSFIGSRTEALKQLTEELFRYTVILSADMPEPEFLDVRAVLEACILDFYTALTERGIEPDIHLPMQKVICRVNRSALTRVFHNILNNALKYSDGDLSVRLGEDGSICFSNQASALDEVSVGKLFNRFFTVRAARSSTGLGLSIAKTLIEQMAGRIAADYQDGRVRILITLPANMGDK